MSLGERWESAADRWEAIGLVPPSDLPAAGARVPAIAVSATLLIAGLALTAVGYGVNGWLVAGGLLSAGAVWAPQYMLGWALILFVAAGELTRRDTLSWHVLVLLAGIHLIHILAMLSLELPRRSWVHPAVFAAPLRRFVAVQVPAQALAVLVLLLLSPDAAGHRPLRAGALAVVGAAAFVGLALVLLEARPDEREP